MHEVGPVAAALDLVVGRWASDRRSGWLHLEIVDGTRAQADSVRFIATTILADRGLDEVTVTVTARPVVCPSCGRTTEPTIAHPICGCGAPLPSVAGPALRCTELSPATEARDGLVVGAGADAG